MPEPSRIADVISRAADRIGGDSARLDAELLLGHALGHTRSWLLAHADEAMQEAACKRAEPLIAARARGVPIAHLLGRRGFWTLDLEVTAATLIPRPETELLVELALQRIPRGQLAHVVDLGTGSGAVALAIASERPLLHVVAIDASAEALAIARRNAVALRLHNIDFVQGDWFAPLGGQRFEMIVGNPPYLAIDDPHLDCGDLRFEPRSALVSGIDGLDAIRGIVRDAHAHLQHAAWLLLEHGWTQGAAVRALLETAGFAEVVTVADLEQRDRVTIGRRMDAQAPI